MDAGNIVYTISADTQQLIEARRDLDGFNRASQSTTTSSDSLNNSLRALDSTIASNARALSDAQSQLNGLTRASNNTSGSTTSLENVIRDLQNALNNSASGLAAAQSQLLGFARASQGGVGSSRNFNTALNSIQAALNASNSQLTDAVNALTRFARASSGSASNTSSLESSINRLGGAINSNVRVINGMNAQLSSMQNAMGSISTSVSSVNVNMSNLNATLANTSQQLNDMIQNLNDVIDANIRASQSANGLNSSLTEIAATIAGIFAANQLAGFIAQTSMAVEEQKLFADSIELSYEQLQRLQYVARSGGVEIDSFNDAIKEMTIQLREASTGDNEDLAKRLEDMGIAIEDIIGLSPDQQFLKIADGLNSIADASYRTVIANDLFGEEATKLVNITKKGSEGITKMGQDVDKLGGIVSSVAADNFVKLNKNIRDIGIAISGVAVQAIEDLSSSMVNITTAIRDFLADSENVEKIINGIGVAATATSVIIVSRLVSSFVSLAAAQATALASSVAAAGGFRALFTAANLAALGTTALAGATRILNGALAIVGGPVGIIFAVASSLGILALNARNSADSITDLSGRIDDLNAAMTGLTEAQLAEQINKDTKAMEGLFNELGEVKKRIEEFKNIKAPSVSQIIANNEDIKMLENIQNKISELGGILNLRVKFREEKEIESEVTKARSKLGDLFKADKIDVDLSELIDFSSGFEIEDDDVSKQIEKKRQEDLDKLAEFLKKIPQVTRTIAEEEEAIVKKFNEITSGIVDPKRVKELEKQRDSELAQARKFYKDRAKDLETARNLEAQINAKYDKLQKEQSDNRLKEIQAAADRLSSIQISATGATITNPRERIEFEYQRSLEAVEKIFAEFPSLIKEKNAAIIALEKKRVNDLQQISKQEEAIRKAASDRVKDIIREANKAISDEYDATYIEEEKALEDLNKLLKEAGSSEEESYNARLALQKKFAKQRADIMADMNQKSLDEFKKGQEQLQKAIEEQEKNNKAFRDFASGLGTKTPLEQIADQEAKALEKLDELWKNSNASLQEYEDAKTLIQEEAAQKRKEIMDDELNTMISNSASLMGGVGDIFSAFADAIAKGAGESSSAYKAMFAISKGFAVAQAGLNLTLAISNALASGPFPANLAAMASVATAGASLVSAIGSASYSGRANGGGVSAGNTYKVNENGVPEVYSYGNSDYLMSSKNASVSKLDDYMDKNGGMGGINIQVINQIPNAEVTASQGVTRDEVIILIKETVPSEISNPNSKTSKALNSSTNNKRRLT